MDITAHSSKRQIIAFRVITTILVVGMLFGGLTALVKTELQVHRFKHLGYPMFLMTIIGISKILAAIVLSVRGVPLLKIGAYVGTFIVSICAFISHIVAGDSAGEIINPLVLTAITMAACFLNPNIRFQQEVKR